MARYHHPAYQRDQWAPEWDQPEAPTYYGHRRGGRLALWAVLMAAGFMLTLGWVLGHDHTPTGLSVRGWATLALAGLVIVLLSLHRRYGGLLLARAIAEYTAVALLAVLLATASTHPQATHRPTTASAGQVCPTVVQAAAGAVCDLVTNLWHRADQPTDRPDRPPTTTRPPKGHAMAPSPTLPTIPSTSRRNRL